jgi:1-deoxy-D-xylulose-5-phosphate synthase
LDIIEIECNPSHYDLGIIKPLDQKLLQDIFENHIAIFTVEDGALAGGAGSAILEWANENGHQHQINRIGIPDRFISHGTKAELQKEIGMDSIGIASSILTLHQKIS